MNICERCKKECEKLHQPIRLECEYCEKCTEELNDLYGDLANYGLV